MILGWADDSIFVRRSDQEPGGEGWKQNGSSSVNAGAFTTGRGRPARVPPPIKPRSQMVSYSIFESIACIGVQQNTFESAEPRAVIFNLLIRLSGPRKTKFK